MSKLAFHHEWKYNCQDFVMRSRIGVGREELSRSSSTVGKSMKQGIPPPPGRLFRVIAFTLSCVKRYQHGKNRSKILYSFCPVRVMNRTAVRAILTAIILSFESFNTPLPSLASVLRSGYLIIEDAKCHDDFFYFSKILTAAKWQEEPRRT